MRMILPEHRLLAMDIGHRKGEVPIQKVLGHRSYETSEFIICQLELSQYLKDYCYFYGN